MKTKVAVEISGHKAWIENVTADAASPPRLPEDTIYVWLSFEEAVGGTLGFGISLPVKRYKQDEFLKTVRREGEHRLKVIMEEDRTKREQRILKEERQKALDQRAEEIKSLIGLD